jgi:hypothetical protein
MRKRKEVLASFSFEIATLLVLGSPNKTETKAINQLQAT